jgi:hypothetical protein
MMKLGTKPAVLHVTWVLMLISCAGSKAKTDVPPPPSVGDAAVIVTDLDAALATPLADASPVQAASAADASDATSGRPFAATAAEATDLINAAVDSRSSQLIECVAAARTRHKKPHARISFDVGIDQEGAFIGVKTPRGQKDDPAFNDCVRSALASAPFPRSHAGVITVNRAFEDKLVH